MCRLDKILVHHSLQCREEARQSNRVPSFRHGASGSIRFGKTHSSIFDASWYKALIARCTEAIDVVSRKPGGKRNLT